MRVVLRVVLILRPKIGDITDHFLRIDAPRERTASGRKFGKRRTNDGILVPIVSCERTAEMLLKLRRLLPDGVQTDVTVNTDQIVWAQADASGDTVAILAVNGPELSVKNNEAAQKLLSGLLGDGA